MKHPSIPLQTAILSILLVLMNPAAAIEVYKWVDVKGATHYGQTPPVTPPASIKKVTLSVHKPQTTEQSGVQAMLDVAKQLEISRLERERFRLEKKKIHIEKLKLLQAEQAAQNESRLSYGRPVYYSPRYRPPHRPHKPHPYKPHRPHPHKPGVHAPGRPSGMHNANHARMSLPH